MSKHTSPEVRNRIAHLMQTKAIGSHQDGGHSMTITRKPKKPIIREDELEREFGFNGGCDVPDDDDYDDDDDDDEWDDEIMEVATDEDAILTDARMILMRHPTKPGKLMMVAQIDNPFDGDYDNPEDGFDLEGDEMWEGQMIILMDRGFGGAKKYRAAAPHPDIFKKKNYRGEIE